MKTIVLVEDDHFLSSVLSAELQRAGFQVFTAFDGKQGVDTTKSKHPDLVLLDILMPVMNGYEALALIKGGIDTKQIPVIILSNLGQPDEIQRAREAGADDYMVKVQFTPKDIVKKIESLLPASDAASAPAAA